MSEILSIFYAEFDNVAGPRIVTQSPEGSMSDDDFDLISDYMITMPDVAGKLVTVAHPGLRGAARPPPPGASPLVALSPAQPPPQPPQPVAVLGFPVSLHHEKYPRNALLFCVGFVLPAGCPSGPYEPVLRKLGAYLYGLEVEGELLSSGRRRREQQQQQQRGAGAPTSAAAAPTGGTATLAALLDAVCSGLNARGECFVHLQPPHAGDTTVALKLFPRLPPPPAVHPHDVPVRVRDADKLAGPGHAGWAGGAAPGLDDSGWDLALRMLLPFIDGVSYVRAIAEAADVELPLALRAVQQLAYYGVLALTDVFAYTNVYQAQPGGLQRLLMRHEDAAGLGRACGRYIAAAAAPAAAAADEYGGVYDDGDDSDDDGGGGDSDDEGAGDAAADDYPCVPLEVAVRLYASFGARARVCDVCAQADTAGLGVDDRRLVTWGVMHGVLRRVHKYPVPVGGGGSSDSAAAAGSGGGFDGSAGSGGSSSSSSAALASSALTDGGGGSSSASRYAPAPHPAPLRLGPRELALMDGSRHCDELCCTLRVSQAALEEAVAAHGGFVFVLR